MDGLKLDFISSDVLESKTSMEKVSTIVKSVKDGIILVIEGGLSPEEEAELIETTMREIDIENFVGIDVHTLEKDEKTFFGLSSKKTAGLTIVGPANIMRSVKKESNFLSMIAELGSSD